jgi:fructoselysine-6-P-deglycase FrlB-like protein
MSQPQWLTRAAELAAEALALPVDAWAPNETVAVVGMGASTHAATVFVEALRAAGQRAVNLDASAIAHYPDDFCLGEHVIIISESGRSPEPLVVAERADVNPIVVTANPDSPLAQLASLVVPLGEFVDSGVYTIGYTTTLVALAAIAQAHGTFLADPASLAEVAEAALTDFSPLASLVADQFGIPQFLDLVGPGPSYGSAQGAALLIRESTNLPAAAYETVQYLHGPMEACGPNRATLLFGDGRERAIAEQIRAAGGLAVQVATTPGEALPGVFRLGTPVTGYPSAIAETVFAQLLAAEWVERGGHQVGNWRFPQPDTKLPE